MKSRFMYSVSGQPGDLNSTFAMLIFRQADTFGQPTKSEAEVNRLLIDANDLTPFDQQTLESQRRLYNASLLPRTRPALKHWAAQRILRGSDHAARARLMELHGIVYLNRTVDCLLEINERDPQLVTYLLEGRIGSAIRHVPEQGYPDDEDEERAWSLDRVMDLIAIVLKLWIANDLQLEAAAAHVRMFRSTGCDVLDYTANGLPILQSTLISRIDEELNLYFEAKRLYDRDKPEPVDESDTSPLGVSTTQASLSSAGACLILRWPTAEPDRFPRSVSDAEAAAFPGPLRLRAQLALAQWRRAHGDQLEAHIAFRIQDAEWRMKRLQRELNAIHCDPSLKRQRAHVRKGEAPLTRLWLACLQAARWVEWIAPPRRSGNILDAMIGVYARDLTEEAVRAVRRGETVILPKEQNHHREIARELFFVLRCTIVRDPEHLPKALRSVTTEAGQVVTAARREDAERLRGRPFTFREIYAYQKSRQASIRNGKEVLSHPFIGIANAFLKSHANGPSAESWAIIDQATGTVGWCLML